MINSFSRAGREGQLTEWLLRVFAIAAYSFFVWNVGRNWLAEPERLTLLMLLVTEGVSLLIVVFARKATLRDLAPLSIMATVYAAYYFVLLRFTGTTRLIPEWMGIAFQLTGLVVQLSAKLALGRSFGLLPAVRGIVTRGPYRYVRHPIYFGYLIAHIGFLLSNFNVQNIGVLMSLYVAQLWRIHREELALSTDPSYATYRKTVTWRLIPGIY